MLHPVLRKLEGFGPLPAEDKAILANLVALEQDVPARTDLICEGDDPTVVHLVTGGFACRYKHPVEALATRHEVCRHVRGSLSSAEGVLVATLFDRAESHAIANT